MEDVRSCWTAVLLGCEQICFQHLLSRNCPRVQSCERAKARLFGHFASMVFVVEGGLWREG